MQLYNSLTRQKELFKLLENKKVKMYVCGITPYDTTHLGHAFTYMSFDVLIRYLQFKGYEVEYTQNVTDIDDDILKRAKQEDRDWQELGQYWTKRFQTDMKKLNILTPTHYVKATSSIETIINIVQTLEENGIAYEKKGNVYFHVPTFQSYGKLSHLAEQQMLLLSRERGANPDDPLKKHPLDFILWQKSKIGEPSWQSPWGKGRPGWHIECSAMIHDTLGEQIDIHGGGRDLIYPHHESEIAQSESFTGKNPFAQYWMHTAMVLCEGEKMSKSLGNLVMVSDLLKKYSANAIRYVLLSHHYRQPWQYEEEELDQAEVKLTNIKNALEGTTSLPSKLTKPLYLKPFITLLDDDMQTPKALELIDDLAEKSNKKKGHTEDYQNTILACLNILGFSL